MIIEGTFYAIQCDNCKALCENGEGYSFWSCKEISKEYASNSLWHNEDGKNYCPECFSIDDEDNIQINLKNKIT